MSTDMEIFISSQQTILSPHVTVRILYFSSLILFSRHKQKILKEKVFVNIDFTVKRTSKIFPVEFIVSLTLQLESGIYTRYIKIYLIILGL